MRRRVSVLLSVRRAVLAASFAVLIAACGGDAGTTNAPVASSVAEVSADADGAARAVDEPVAAGSELDMEGVVAAALLIASGGDLEGAISSGLVGEAEAEAALDALERGSLDQVLGG